MKLILIAALSLFSVSSFARDLPSTIKKIEFSKNAKCSQISTSRGISFGGNVSFYTVRYSCLSNDTDFALKIRMFGSKVRKVIFVD